MKEPRCPDCGYRLKTNECPICCKRVPFPVTLRPESTQTRGRRKVQVSFPKPVSGRKRRAVSPKQKTIWTVVAVVLAFAPLIGELLDEIHPPQPEYRDNSYYEDYLPAGAAGAAHIPSMEQQTLYDNQGILVTADSFGLLYDEPAVAMTVANTSERNISVSVSSMAVNGYMMNYSGLYCEAQAGETVQAFLWLDRDDLQNAGIDTVADMVLQLDIYDADDYEDIASELRIGLQTSAAGFAQKVDDSGKTVYEDGGVRLIFRHAEVDEYGNAEFSFFAENLTEDPLYIGSDSLTVNGEETDAMLWCWLWPDTRCIDSVYLYEMSDYDIHQTGDLKQICLELYVENGTSWQRTNRTVVINLDK